MSCQGKYIMLEVPDGRMVKNNASQWHKMHCRDLKVKGSNPSGSNIGCIVLLIRT